MRTGKKTILLVVLGLLEVVFVSWVLASNIPRRSADVEAFRQYQNVPTAENYELWMKERQVTQNEVTWRKYSGTFLGLGNLLLLGWLARKRPVQSAPRASDTEIFRPAQNDNRKARQSKEGSA
jgi:hypothetical protein